MNFNTVATNMKATNSSDCEKTSKTHNEWKDDTRIQGNSKEIQKERRPHNSDKVPVTCRDLFLFAVYFYILYVNYVI